MGNPMFPTNKMGTWGVEFVEDLFDYIFKPKMSIIFARSDDLNTLFQDIIEDSLTLSADETLKEAFHYSICMQLNLPETFHKSFEGLWPAKGCQLQDIVDSALWNMISEDIIVGALVYFRRQLPAPEYSLFELCKGYTFEDYGNFNRYLRKLPSSLQSLLGISQSQSGKKYTISTHYPHMVASLIKHAKGSPVSRRPKTKNSYAMNRSTFCDCIGDITRPQKQDASHPREEVYFFERLFSIGVRILLCEEFVVGELPSALVSLARLMPNVLARPSLINGVLTLYDQKKIDFETAETSLILIGGYIFPTCQRIFCCALFRKYNGDYHKIVSQLEHMSIFEEKFSSPLLDYETKWRSSISQDMDFITPSLKHVDPTRAEKERYTKWFSSWNTQWESEPEEIVAMLRDGVEPFDFDCGTWILDSNLFSPDVILHYLADYSDSFEEENPPSPLLE